MELRDVIAWVDARKAELGLSDSQAEKRSGCPSLIQNMRKTLKGGPKSLPKVASLRKLASVLGEPPPGLFDPLTPLGAPRNDRPVDDRARLRQQLALYRQQEAEARANAEKIEFALAQLERKAG